MMEDVDFYIQEFSKRGYSFEQEETRFAFGCLEEFDTIRLFDKCTNLPDCVEKIVLKYWDRYGILKECVIKTQHESDEGFPLRENEEELLAELLQERV